MAVVLRIRKQPVVVAAIDVKKTTQVKIIPNTTGTHVVEGEIGIQMFKVACKYDAKIMTDISRAYHTPCGIQSLEVAASVKAWAMITAVVVISVVVIVMVVALISVLVVLVLIMKVVIVVVTVVTLVMVLTAVVVVAVVSEVALLVVVVMVVVVVKALVCAGAVIDTFVEMLIVDM